MGCGGRPSMRGLAMDEPGPQFEGMTLNERLVAADLLDAWDAAVTARDRAEILGILRRVVVSKPDEMADAVLRRSAKHRL
jgi:hypothetical protein